MELAETRMDMLNLRFISQCGARRRNMFADADHDLPRLVPLVWPEKSAYIYGDIEREYATDWTKTATIISE